MIACPSHPVSDLAHRHMTLTRRCRAARGSIMRHRAELPAALLPLAHAVCRSLADAGADPAALPCQLEACRRMLAAEIARLDAAASSRGEAPVALLTLRRILYGLDRAAEAATDLEDFRCALERASETWSEILAAPARPVTAPTTAPSASR